MCDVGPQACSHAQGGRGASEPSVTAAPRPPVPPRRGPHWEPQFRATEGDLGRLGAMADRVPCGLYLASERFMHVLTQP